MSYTVDYVVESKINDRQKINYVIEHNESIANEEQLERLQAVIEASKKD